MALPMCRWCPACVHGDCRCACESCTSRDAQELREYVRELARFVKASPHGYRHAMPCDRCQIANCTCNCIVCCSPPAQRARALIRAIRAKAELYENRDYTKFTMEPAPLAPQSAAPPAITLIKSPAPIATAYCPTCGLGLRICIVRDVRVLQHASPSCESFEKLSAVVIYARTPWIEVPRG